MLLVVGRGIIDAHMTGLCATKFPKEIPSTGGPGRRYSHFASARKLSCLTSVLARTIMAGACLQVEPAGPLCDKLTRNRIQDAWGRIIFEIRTVIWTFIEVRTCVFWLQNWPDVGTYEGDPDYWGRPPSRSKNVRSFLSTQGPVLNDLWIVHIRGVAFFPTQELHQLDLECVLGLQ